MRRQHARLLMAMGIAGYAAAVPLDAAGPLLRNAAVAVEMTSPTTCEVRATFTVDGAAAAGLDHRIRVFDGTIIELESTDGAVATPVAVRGRTQSLVLRPAGAGPQTYVVHYRATQPSSLAYQCPLWVPTAPTDGRTRGVELRATIPPGAAPLGGTFPAFTWEQGHGMARLGHVPSLVRVPYALAGAASQQANVDVARRIDMLTMVLLFVGTALFAWRRKAR